MTSVTLAVGPVGAGLLYRTDFEDFTAGDDHWANVNGWIGNSTGVGVHGIDQDAIAGGALGRTAFIGFKQPSATFVFVAKPINYAPLAGDLPLIRVETLLGIQDSSNAYRDSFCVGIYNKTGSRLAGIRFDNRIATYGIWRADGINPEYDTGVIFYRGEIHLLSFTINLTTNLWSAELNGIPLFKNVQFTATSSAVNFGMLAYEWRLESTLTTNHGDNWMLIADTVVRSAPLGIDPFRVSSLVRSAGTTLTWPGQNGFDYQIEYSDTLGNWHNDLSNSAFPSVLIDQPIQFQDTTPGLTRRFYRVLRTETP
jgi:hypothetical protein